MQSTIAPFFRGRGQLVRPFTRSDFAMVKLRTRPEYLREELLALVGKISLQWAYIDFLVGELLGGLKGVKGQARAQQIHPLDTLHKSEKARKLAKSSFTDHGERQKILGILKQVDELALDRNLVIHGMVIYAKPDNSTDPQIMIFRGKYRGTLKPFSKSLLEPLFDQLSELAAELMDVCLRHGFSEFIKRAK